MSGLSVVHLIWLDSQSVNIWTEVGEFAEPLKEIHSVGFLIHQDEEKFVLSVSFDPDLSSANGVMSVPRSAVRSFRPICGINFTP